MPKRKTRNPLLEKIAHKFEHKLRPYGDVKIHPGIIAEKSKFSKEEIENLTKKGKRWYVYYEYRIDEKTNTWEQIREYARINHQFRGPGTFYEKRKYILQLQDAVTELLEHGYVPEKAKKSNPALNTYTAEDAIAYGLDKKRDKKIKATTYRDYESRINDFKTFLKKKNLLYADVKLITKAHVILYLDQVQKRSSSKNRDNNRLAISAIWTELEKADIIEKNFIRDNIHSEDRKKTTHLAFTDQQKEEIETFMYNEVPILARFIRIWSMQFLRPQDLCNLKCGNIHLDQRIIDLERKTDRSDQLSRRIIPEILVPDYEFLLSFDHNSEDYLIHYSGRPGPWDLKEGAKGRRNHFTKEFKNKVKPHFNLQDGYNMYSFRHTYATLALKSLISKYGDLETSKNKLMEIGGWKSRQAMDRYLASIQFQYHEDYSDHLHITKKPL